MQPLHHNLLTSAKAIVLALLLSVGMSYIYAAWSNPTAVPPNGNVAVPLNTGTTGQTKSSWLIANQFIVTNPAGDVTSPKFCIGASCVTSWVGGTAGVIPQGAIVFFAGPCPSGWTTYTAASGRYIRVNSAGMGTTGTDPFSHAHDYVQFSSENGSATLSPTSPTAINIPYIELRACQAP